MVCPYLGESTRFRSILKALKVYGPLVFVIGCSPRSRALATKPLPDFYGYIVLDSVAATQYGFARGDTLEEIRPTGAPAPVVKKADLEVASERFDNGCTRYFRREDLYLVLLVAQCGDAAELEDGRGMAVMKKTGESIGKTAWWLSGHYSALWPVARRHI